MNMFLSETLVSSLSPEATPSKVISLLFESREQSISQKRLRHMAEFCAATHPAMNAGEIRLCTPRNGRRKLHTVVLNPSINGGGMGFADAIVASCPLLLTMTDNEMGTGGASVAGLFVSVAAHLGIGIAMDMSPQGAAYRSGRRPASDIARCVGQSSPPRGSDRSHRCRAGAVFPPAL